MAPRPSTPRAVSASKTAKARAHRSASPQVDSYPDISPRDTGIADDAAGAGHHEGPPPPDEQAEQEGAEQAHRTPAAVHAMPVPCDLRLSLPASEG